MRLSTEQVLTTHVGSLPRPAELETMLLHREKGRLAPHDRERLPGVVAEAVNRAVHRQAELGVDIVCDGAGPAFWPTRRTIARPG